MRNKQLGVATSTGIAACPPGQFCNMLSLGPAVPIPIAPTQLSPIVALQPIVVPVSTNAQAPDSTSPIVVSALTPAAVPVDESDAPAMTVAATPVPAATSFPVLPVVAGVLALLFFMRK